MENNQNTSEEIDLGQLFKLIGDALNKFFKFIRNIFVGIFHLFIGFLQFIRTHALKFAIAGILGIILGWFLDSKAEPTYRSSMIVEPNFNSIQQLYNNIEFYDELASQDESEALADALKIQQEEAKTISKVVIESFSDQTQKIKQFSEFIQQLDTASRRLVNYKDYLENFNDINAKFHKIVIESTNPRVAKKCQPAIVKSIENNQYFKLQKKVNDENLAIQDSIIDKQLTEIDSLQKFYERIKIIEANKPSGSTSINLAESSNDPVSEIELLKQTRKLKEEKVALNIRRANTENTINVISDFPNKGALVNDFITKKKVLLPIIFVILTFVFLVLVRVNNFLKDYNFN